MVTTYHHYLHGMQHSSAEFLENEIKMNRKAKQFLIHHSNDAYWLKLRSYPYARKKETVATVIVNCDRFRPVQEIRVELFSSCEGASCWAKSTFILHGWRQAGKSTIIQNVDHSKQSLWLLNSSVLDSWTMQHSFWCVPETFGWVVETNFNFINKVEKILFHFCNLRNFSWLVQVRLCQCVIKRWCEDAKLK